MFKRIGLWMASFFAEREKITEVKEVPEKKKHVSTYHARKRLEERHGDVLTK